VAGSWAGFLYETYENSQRIEPEFHILKLKHRDN